MGLLPCLRRGSDRWWLPRNLETTEALGLLCLRVAATANPPAAEDLHPQQSQEVRAQAIAGVDGNTRARLARAMRSDPPLFIFAALGLAESADSSRAVDPDQLVDWLILEAPQRLSSGDAYLGAPQITATMQQQWQRLRDQFRTLPMQDWLNDAALWLEVSGPQVSPTWKQQWPPINPPNGDFANSLAQEPTVQADNLLHQLALNTERMQTLQSSFDRVLQQSKLESLQQLAYGLSHEINNPLANISTRAQQLQRGEVDPARVETLQRIMNQVYRAHEMIADLMFYANPPSAMRSRCDLNQVLHQVVDSFREQAASQSIRLEVATPGDPSPAVVDENMIAEALRALVRNAIDAVGINGTIVVSLVREPNQLMIHVADSGPGLSDQARKHAFDPYFSGREAGRGLGLGLCRAYRIAKLHFGEISLAGGPIGCVATITLNDFV